MNQLIDDHFEEAGLNYIDLMLIHNNRCDWVPTVKGLLEYKKVGKLGDVGVSNFSIEDLERYKVVFGEYPAYNEFEINPLYTPLDVINFCKDHDIKIIAYCILGGKYNADNMVKIYTLSYLVSYAASLADHVILRSDNVDHIRSMVLTYNEDLVVDKYKNSAVDDEEKVMVPMKYRPQLRMALNDGIVLYQGNQYCSESVSMSEALSLVNTYEDADIDVTDFLINTAGFEFITDYRVYLRTYLRQQGYKIVGISSDMCYTDDMMYQIYIVDGDNLSKVKTSTGRLLVKQFRRLERV
jgi:hypothetical protein